MYYLEVCPLLLIVIETHGDLDKVHYLLYYATAIGSGRFRNFVPKS